MNSYEAPAQKPQEITYSQQQPQISFRSPSGQFSPIGSKFAVPNAPEGLAYYSPNLQSNLYDENNKFQQTNGYGATPLAHVNKKPPVLLIGNFPPRSPQQTKNNVPVTFPYIPQTTSSQYHNPRYPSSYNNDNEYGKIF